MYIHIIYMYIHIIYMYIIYGKIMRNWDNDISLVLQIASEKVFRPQKTTPNTVSGVWSCKVYIYVCKVMK